tara:strand:+ start:3334 stop:3519 length:186 start_codon:yes stop_codon:yes gene_type:complete
VQSHTIETNEVQLANALSPTAFTLGGTTTDVTVLDPANAPSATEVTVPGIITGVLPDIVWK